MPADALLRARSLTKRFGGVTALDRVDFDLYEGEIHALCGENGAGKSTLIKLLSGIHPFGSYEGGFELRGRPARFESVADAEAAGIAVIHQELALVGEMSVAENLFLGSEPVRGAFIDYERMLGQSRELLRRFGLAIDPSLPAGSLGMGQRQLVEILKALRKNSGILILDEPTAALSEAESRRLLSILRDLRAQGISCVYISHRLEEIFALADRITVLRDGSTVATLRREDADPKLLIRHMVGREISELFPRRRAARGEAVLSVSHLSVEPEGGGRTLEDISFELHAGEVLGIGGLMGAGRSELLMHLFGAWGRRRSGSVRLAGAELACGGPEESIRRGLALVSEDRRRHGLFRGQDIRFNLSLSSLERFSRRGLVDSTVEGAAALSMFSSLKVRASGIGVDVGGLSGGNQQKVVLGKALMTDPRVVLLDEPTRGIDVGSKQEVYAFINDLTDSGRGVLLVSSELGELMGMSDRILMMRDGHAVGEFSPESDARALIAAALGHA